MEFEGLPSEIRESVDWRSNRNVHRTSMSSMGPLAKGSSTAALTTAPIDPWPPRSSSSAGTCSTVSYQKLTVSYTAAHRLSSGSIACWTSAGTDSSAALVARTTSSSDGLDPSESLIAVRKASTSELETLSGIALDRLTAVGGSTDARVHEWESSHRGLRVQGLGHFVISCGGPCVSNQQWRGGLRIPVTQRQVPP
jgi:hypothetical protein